jgi:hypothetical protein
MLLASAPAAAQAVPEWFRTALEAACTEDEAVDGVLAATGGAIVLASEALDAPAGMQARRHRVLLRDGGRLRLDRHHREGTLRQVILEWEARVHGQRRPLLWVVADGACGVRVARRLVYRDRAVAVAVEDLERDLGGVRSRVALDEAVPPGAPPAGVPVAMVDSGVNYTLPALAARLARGPGGQALGHDYWDGDPRPFDSHPSRSPYVPRRHGTRTASLLLEEAPVATLVPMRYPRPDMSLMGALVADLHAKGIGIVNLSLGGKDAAEWRHFERAARAHPRILFVASAGNDGRDLDQRPAYPASLELENLITVTSADGQGLPARGANWGKRTVDLLVPAEGLVTTGFDGYAREVSGSSYAAVRVSALAACLKAEHPDWGAKELREAIFAMATMPVHSSVAYVRVGLLSDPTLAPRGACAAEPSEPQRIARMTLSPQGVYPEGVPGDAPHEVAPLTLVWMEGANWSLGSLLPAVATAAGIYAQCGLRFGAVHVELWRVPARLRYYHTDNALELMRRLAVDRPAVWFVRDTLQRPAFDAETVGRSNARGREGAMNTLWLTSHLRHPGVALAHELYHMLANTGAHVPEKGNLMHTDTAPGAVTLEDWQCERLLDVGTAFDLVR